MLAGVKGRPPIDQAQRKRDRRRRVLERGLIAGYELMEGIRKEMAELDAADHAPRRPQDDEAFECMDQD